MPRVPGGRSTIATVWKFRSAFLCSWDTEVLEGRACH